MSADRTATVFGAGFRSAPAYAAFTNAIMVRSLDWTDGMLAQGGGHPSDMISGILAAAETTGASGKDTLLSVILSYELLGGLGRVAPATTKGLDQGLFMGVAAAMGIGRLHGLDRTQLANAASMAIVPAIPLLVTRRGALSMWKGAATAASILNATNAVAFAKAGMTGPDEPFEGISGVMDVLTGRFDLSLPAYPGGKFVVEISHQKKFPAESHSQALLGLLPELRAFAGVDDIASIDVEAYAVLLNAIGRHPSVWDPKTRETADHSLPYLLSVGLTDGDVTVESFTPERIADPALRPLMAKVHITENPEFTAGYRPPGLEIAGSPKVRITVTRDDGATFHRELGYPRGHTLNPMSKADVDEKLAKVCAGVLSDARRDELGAAWWDIENASKIDGLMEQLADFGTTTGDATR
jgi:2-methylcitrate dehydratase